MIPPEIIIIIHWSLALHEPHLYEHLSENASLYEVFQNK